MPVYEYQCQGCGYRFELISKQFIDKGDSLAHNCPKCNAASHRVYSSYSFQFSPYLRELGGNRMVDY